MNQLVLSKADGSKVLALILEPGNLHRLQEGQPIFLHVESLFPDGIPARLELGVFFTDTPEADAQEIAKMAAVNLDERTPVKRSKRPHCPECHSTIEEMGLMHSESSPVEVFFCAMCGCALGVKL